MQPTFHQKLTVLCLISNLSPNMVVEVVENIFNLDFNEANNLVSLIVNRYRLINENILEKMPNGVCIFETKSTRWAITNRFLANCSHHLQEKLKDAMASYL